MNEISSVPKGIKQHELGKSIYNIRCSERCQTAQKTKQNKQTIPKQEAAKDTQKQ